MSIPEYAPNKKIGQPCDARAAALRSSDTSEGLCGLHDSGTDLRFFPILDQTPAFRGLASDDLIIPPFTTGEIINFLHPSASTAPKLIQSVGHIFPPGLKLVGEGSR